MYAKRESYILASVLFVFFQFSVFWTGKKLVEFSALFEKKEKTDSFQKSQKENMKILFVKIRFHEYKLENR